MSVADSGIAIVSTVCVFAVLVVALWQGFRTWQTRIATQASAAQEEAYRALAERATAAQRESAAEQRAMAAALAEVQGRLAAIETLLREVG